MQASFSAYSQATKHHSLVLSDMRKEVDELRLSNISKDAIIGQMAAAITELKEINTKICADILELKEGRGGK